MKAYNLLQKHGLEPTYGRLGKINDWYSRNPGKRATLLTVPRNRRLRKDYELVGRVAVPQCDVWITLHDDSQDRARELLKQYGFTPTHHRISNIADWLRTYPSVKPVLVLVTRKTKDPDIIGTCQKQRKDILIRDA